MNFKAFVPKPETGYQKCTWQKVKTSSEMYHQIYLPEKNTLRERETIFSPIDLFLRMTYHPATNSCISYVDRGCDCEIGIRY